MPHSFFVSVMRTALFATVLRVEPGGTAERESFLSIHAGEGLPFLERDKFLVACRYISGDVLFHQTSGDPLWSVGHNLPPDRETLIVGL